MSSDAYAKVREADQALAAASRGFGIFGNFGNKSQKLEDAAGAYKSAAATLFNESGKGMEAGRLYEKAAAVYRDRLKEPIDMATCYDEAAIAYKKAADKYSDAAGKYSEGKPMDKGNLDVPPEAAAQESARVYVQLIEHWKNASDYKRAADKSVKLGEIYEQNLQDWAKASEAYETAGQWYENAGQTSTANRYYGKAADLSMERTQDYEKAIYYYEKLAKSYDAKNDNNMRFSIKYVYFKAALCLLASGDMVLTKRKLEEYRQVDPGFGDQNYYFFFLSLMQAIEQNEVHAFEQEVEKYQKTNPMDRWKTVMLDRIKDRIGSGEEDFA